MALESLFGVKIFKGEVAAGTMHFLIFWGFLALFLGTLTLSVHHYLVPILTGTPYLVFSLSMEVAGLMLGSSLCWALWRRYITRVPRLERRPQDLLLPLWLLVITMSGYLLEAARLSALDPQWAPWSFVGERLSFFFTTTSETQQGYVYLWWTHAMISLGFVASIPYTKLFHILASPLSIYLQSSPSRDSGEPVSEGFKIKDVVFFSACMRCGRCVEKCPPTIAGEPFAPRELIQELKRRYWPNLLQASYYKDQAGSAVPPPSSVWHCTTCSACLEVCPVHGPTFEAVFAERARVVEDGTTLPSLMAQTLERLYRYNNPWEASKKKRAAWSKGLGILDITRTDERVDVCYFVGCTTSFDTRAQGIARAFTAILEHSGVNFGTLGKKEPCCGDIARVSGELGLFQDQQEECNSLFSKYSITKLITSSPHCFHTLRNHYGNPSFSALHYTQFLFGLLEEGKLKFKEEFPATVTYHDPCYLGRHNRIFEEPRRVLTAIPGVRLVEMPNHGTGSLCCGGGGARMWQEELDAETKISEIRIREAAETGAGVLITACPLCLIMLEDARKTAGLEEILEVLDLNELVLKALGIESRREENG